MLRTPKENADIVATPVALFQMWTAYIHNSRILIDAKSVIMLFWSFFVFA